MKYVVCFITMLLLLFGCKEESPNTHHFELMAAKNDEEVSKGVFLVGWIRVLVLGNANDVQIISVKMDESDYYDRWVRYELAKNDINFDGYTDIGVHQYGGDKMG